MDDNLKIHKAAHEDRSRSNNPRLQENPARRNMRRSALRGNNLIEMQ